LLRYIGKDSHWSHRGSGTIGEKRLGGVTPRENAEGRRHLRRAGFSSAEIALLFGPPTLAERVEHVWEWVKPKARLTFIAVVAAVLVACGLVLALLAVVWSVCWLSRQQFQIAPVLRLLKRDIAFDGVWG
jgi:hypothetical protein